MVPSSTRVDCSNANNKRIESEFIFIQLFISIDSRANEKSESFSHNPFFFSHPLELIMLNVKKGKNIMTTHISTTMCMNMSRKKEEEKKVSKVSKILRV